MMNKKITRTIVTAKTAITMQVNGEIVIKDYEGELSQRACKKRAADENAEFISMAVIKREQRYEMDIETFKKYATMTDIEDED